MKNDQSDDISLSQFVSFYENNFTESNTADQAIKDARDKINIQYSAERNSIYKDSCVPVCKIEQLIKQLNQNSSPDMDGVQQDI